MKKEKIKVIVISIVLVLLFTFSISYAYYAVSTTNSFGTQNLSVSVENAGSVVFEKNDNANLNFNLSSDQFPGGNTNNYSSYSSSVGTISAVGSDSYNCALTLSITATASSEENNLYNAFQNMETKSRDQIYLRINLNNNSYKLDFYNENLFDNKTITYQFNITGGTSYYLNTYLYFYNSNVIQDDLAGKDITIDINATDFTCNVITSTGGKYILANNNLKANLSNSLTNDLNGQMYRYQGNYNDVNNNYICFGTVDKTTCLNNKENYLFRILGIKPNGQLKIIREYTISGGLQFNDNSSVSNYSFSNSSIGFYLHSTYLNSFTNDWQSLILPSMKYSSTRITSAQKGTYNASSIINVEDDAYSSVKIGLLSLSDYYYANGWSGTGSGIPNSNGWIHRSHSLSNASSTEWLINIFSDTKAFIVKTNGDVTAQSISSKYGARPVFYVTNMMELSGTGTLSDPYMISWNY